MLPARNKLKVLVVDDDRDGADALGMVIEALGNQVHVTYGGTQALGVAAAFRPDVMLIDLAMPEVNGCDLAVRFRQNPDFAHAKIVAITGHHHEGHKSLALKSGFDHVLLKPVSLAQITEVLGDVVPSSASEGMPVDAQENKALTIDEARRIRSGRESKVLTPAESEAAICEAIRAFYHEYLGWQSERYRADLFKDLLVVRIQGATPPGEQELCKTATTQRNLAKQMRKQLLELARPMLESLVYEVIGVKSITMLHETHSATGEEVIVFSLAASPRVE